MGLACGAKGAKVEEMLPVGDEGRVDQLGGGVEGQHHSRLLRLASRGYEIHVRLLRGNVGKHPIVEKRGTAVGNLARQLHKLLTADFQHATAQLA